MKITLVMISLLLISCGSDSNKQVNPQNISDQGAGTWASCEVKNKTTQKFDLCIAHRLKELKDKSVENQIKDQLKASCDQFDSADDKEGHFSRNSKCTKTPNSYFSHGCLQSTTTPGTNMVLQQFTLNFASTIESAKETCDSLKEALKDMPDELRKRHSVEWVKR